MPDTRSMPEKLPFTNPESSYQRSINDMFARMVDGMSPSRAIKARFYPDPSGDKWHPIREVHLVRGAPRDRLTGGEFIDVWARAKKMKSVKSIDKAWRTKKKDYGFTQKEAMWGLHTLADARELYERDRGDAAAAVWWRRLPHPHAILPEHREEAANEIWRQLVAEMRWFEVQQGMIRPRPATIDAGPVCSVCGSPLDQKPKGRPSRYCSQPRPCRQQREYERDRLVRKVESIGRLLY